MSLLFSLMCRSLPYIYTLSLHDALPIFSGYDGHIGRVNIPVDPPPVEQVGITGRVIDGLTDGNARFAKPIKFQITVTNTDRKSTRLNSSHTVISYAVFCLKKKNKHDPAG